jgi:hypothetical protein
MTEQSPQEPRPIDESHFVADAVSVALIQLGSRPIVSLAQARQLIGDESAKLYRLLLEADGYPSWPWEQARRHLLAIAATCIQASQQLGLDHRQDAIEKEIPF